MRLLLDTHALLWWLLDDNRLGPQTRVRIGDPGNEVLVSVVSLWEIAVKQRIGKLIADMAEVARAVQQGGFTRLAITDAHLFILVSLPTHHRDPFDHLLMAQSIGEGALFVSNDEHVRSYPVNVVSCVE